MIDRNKSWEIGSNTETDLLWSTGVPGITGWVQIENPRSYNLPLGIPAYNSSDEVYITTWGHQHHCLVSSVSSD